jgi:hypothetical protein
VPAHGTPNEIYARTWICGRAVRAGLTPPAGAAEHGAAVAGEAPAPPEPSP